MADSTYDQLYGQKTDGICIYIDVSSNAHPYDYISTSGMAQFYYTNSDSNNRINSMHYAIDKYLYPIGSEDVSGALNEFADQLENYYEAGIPDAYYVYDDVYHKYYHVENGEIITTFRKPYHDVERLFLGGIMGLLIGIMIAAIVKGSIKAKYKFIYELSPTTYLNKKSVQLQSVRQIYPGTHYENACFQQQFRRKKRRKPPFRRRSLPRRSRRRRSSQII